VEVEPLTSSQPRLASTATTSIIDKDLNNKEVVGSLAVPHMNSSAAKPPAPLVLDTNPDTAAIDITDVVAPTTTRCVSVTECSDDDNNDPNKATHVITIRVNYP
jgi:hypothetical protein